MKRIWKVMMCMLVAAMFVMPIVSTEKGPGNRPASIEQNRCQASVLDDQLDQSQTKSEGEDYGITLGNYESDNTIYNQELAQSFKPTLNILTRVFLNVKTYYPETVDYPVTVVIRDAVDGQDLTSATVDAEGIEPPWTEFDFDDIGVTPGESYYIVAMAKGGQNTKGYAWGFGDNNPYGRGEAWWRTASPEPIEWVEIYILESPDLMFQTYGYQEDPPQKPARPTGSTSGEVGEPYEYTSSTIESNGDQIYYLFDWGDNTDSEWIGPYESGEEVSAEHTWSRRGNYEIRVKAKDEHGAESEWSDPLAVSMPKAYDRPVLPLLEQFTNWLMEMLWTAQ